MKKYFSNIRTLVILLMAGTALVACTSDDSIIDEQNINLAGEQVYKLTIKTSNDNVDTRALSLNEAGQLSASWEIGDELAVTNGTTALESSLKCTEINDDEATFSGTIKGSVNVGDELTLTYHPITGYSAFGNQDGTLHSAEKYDIATGTVTVESVDDDNNITLNESSVTFDNQSAVMKLKLTTDGETTINPTKLKVSATIATFTKDIFTLTIPEDTYTTNGNGILYFALPSVAMVASRLAEEMSQPENVVMSLLAAAKITFAATVGSDTYTVTKDGYPFKGGKYYTSTLTMEMDKVPVDLSQLTRSYTAKDGDVLTGTLANNVKISIAENAKVTLSGVNINGEGTWDSGEYAGINCEGDAEITLVGTNTVKGFNENYPGIYVLDGNTLTINGEGSLNASSNGKGAGIGGGNQNDCGNIIIQGGDITATGGTQAAGIGGGFTAKCGNIEISGGTITATGGEGAAGIGTGDYGTAEDNDYIDITISGGTVKAYGGQNAAGIGSGNFSPCGNIVISGGTVEATGGDEAAGIGTGNEGLCTSITITSSVTSVIATKGNNSPNSIGAGSNAQYCGDVTIKDESKVTQN